MGCSPSFEFAFPSNSKFGIIPHAKGLVGLQNLGNTCFMNSAVQCLVNTSQLVDYFSDPNWKSDINRTNPLGKNGEIAEAFGDLLNSIWMSERSVSSIAPNKLRNALTKYQPIFRGGNQHDAQELLSFLLDGLHEDLNRVKSKPQVEDVISDGSKDDLEIASESWNRYQMRNRSIIVDLLQGQLKCMLKCLTCEEISVKFDPFMYISLPIKQSKSKKASTLEKCLSEFCKEEKLTGEHRWFCPKCNQNRDSEKKIVPWNAPPILIVHLKRFFVDSRGHRVKDNRHVVFPVENFDMSPYILSEDFKSKAKYNLYGVSNHHGSLHSGHYTAIIRNKCDGKWYLFNDSNYSEIEASQVCSKGAYVLFYQRADLVQQNQRPISRSTMDSINTASNSTTCSTQVSTQSSFSDGADAEHLKNIRSNTEVLTKPIRSANSNIDKLESSPSVFQGKLSTIRGRSQSYGNSSRIYSTPTIEMSKSNESPSKIKIIHVSSTGSDQSLGGPSLEFSGTRENIIDPSYYQKMLSLSESSHLQPQFMSPTLSPPPPPIPTATLSPSHAQSQSSFSKSKRPFYKRSRAATLPAEETAMVDAFFSSQAK